MRALAGRLAGRVGRALGWHERPFHLQMLMLFAAVCLVPLALSNAWGYLQSRRYLTELAVQDVRHVAALEASQTVELVRDDRRLLPALLAGNEHLFDTLRELEAEPSPQRVAAVERHLAAKAAESSRLEDLWIISPAGELVASSRRSPEPAALSAACRTQARGGGAAEIRHGLGGPALLVASTVTADDGAPLGVLCGRFGFEALHRALVGPHQERPADATVFLIDADGGVITAPAAAEHAQGVKAALVGLPVGRAASWHGRVKVEGLGELLAAYAPVADLRGGVLVTVPINTALASLERLKWQAVGTGVLLAPALFALVLLVARALTRPLKTLSDASRRAATGELAQVAAGGGSAEIGELARTFNQMAAALKASRDSLEDRIAERTRDLQHSREFAELLLNSIDQSVIVIDRSHRVVRANQAARTMYGADLVGQPCCDTLPECWDSDDACPGCDTFRTGQAGAREQPVRIGGSQEILSVQTFPIRSSGGEVDAVMRMGRLVTAEKRMQAQMVHNERMAAFGLLAAGVAHEIGNPLASIESQLGMARRVPDPHRVEQTLSIVEREVQRIARLLRELVDFSRRRRTDMTLVSLNQVVEDVARLLGHDPRAANVGLEQKLGPSLPGVRAKEDQLVQVLLNLGINALDAVHGHGRIVFETAHEDGELVLRIHDTGGGVPADARDRIFEPFFTTKEPGRGTGLGLFVSRGIVESLGGSLGLEGSSQAGSVFVVRLPVHGRARAAGAADAAAPGAGPDARAHEGMAAHAGAVDVGPRGAA